MGVISFFLMFFLGRSVRQIENTIASLGFMKATDYPQFATVCNIENGEIVDLPIKNGDFSW